MQAGLFTQEWDKRVKTQGWETEQVRLEVHYLLFYFKHMLYHYYTKKLMQKMG